MSCLADDMVVAYQDWEDNKGGDADYFWAIFVEKRQIWRDAGKPS